MTTISLEKESSTAQSIMVRSATLCARNGGIHLGFNSHPKFATRNDSFGNEIRILCRGVMLLATFLAKELSTAPSIVVRSTRLCARNKAIYACFISHIKRSAQSSLLIYKSRISCRGVILLVTFFRKELYAAPSIVLRQTRL